MIMVNFTVSITLSTPALRRLLDDAEKEGKDEKQMVRSIIQKKYEKMEGK